MIGVYVGRLKGAGKIAVESAELVPNYGLDGDTHAGRDPDRQVSLFSTEVLRDLQAEGFNVSAPELSTNLLTENIALNSLKPGTQLRVGETVIEIVEERKPCRSITRIDHRLPKRLYGQCGQLARIVKGGSIRTGDQIEVLADEKHLELDF
ncbi:MAG TPA: MOSC domain-containing protein [Blastocatellia bacterium]|nr:MOSC domain-containing protein [Blastocatellia bacterium]